MPESQPLDVTAFVGGDLYGLNAVQLTIGGNYTCLIVYQITELVTLLVRRLAGHPDTSATRYNLDLEFDAEEMHDEK